MPSDDYGILVGYDGSPGSEQALAWAAREARSRAITLTVCQAWAPGYPVPPSEAAALHYARGSGERVLAEGLRLARSVMGSGEVRPLLVGGRPAQVLSEHSAAAQMVVVGSRGHGGLAGLLLGSVSLQVATHANGPAVVVRGHWRSAACQPRPVVVGIDGSDAAQAAAAFAFKEAALRDAPLLAVCALADSPGALGGAGQMRQEFEEAIDRQEKEHPGVTVQRQVTDGPARTALLDAARDAQMLVVGYRGRGGVRGMLGSVSHAVLHHAPCPVGIVHPQ